MTRHDSRAAAPTRRRFLQGMAALGVGGSVLAACGDDDDDDSAAEDSPAMEETSTTAGATPTSAPAGGGTTATKPVFEVPAGDPPKELQTKDITVGTGAEAVAGKTVTIHYVGKAYSSRQQFDASWDGGQPFPFMLGANPLQVVPGFDKGVTGMKVGGRRQVIIPPALGYGDNPPTDKIKPGDTLVFVIDLVNVS
jgi:peptidylprolyl isomerase